jgi:hypothetical protein
VASGTSLGVDPVYGWIGTAERHFGALTWALCGLMFAAAGAASAWAVAQELGWQQVHLAGSSRLTGSLGSAAYLGAAMALAMALGVALDRSWSQTARRGAVVAVALSGAALLGSGARAAWVGVAVASNVIVSVTLQTNSPRTSRADRGAGRIAVVVTELRRTDDRRIHYLASDRVTRPTA